MTFDLNSSKPYEFRCPIHGFIVLNDWERAIISEPAFQRLRRIRQLAWTDRVYPGAMHTRFEHSLGVMHTATLMYDTIRERSREILESEFMYNSAGLDRDRQLVRLAALLHDVGHGPFSHASEDLLPPSEVAEARYTHEQYSAAIVRLQLRDVIDNHPHNNANYGFKADDVASLLEGSSKARQALFWRDLIDGQLDADRMDYLLRDSYHVGVQYGQFDLNRLIQTIEAISGDERGLAQDWYKRGRISCRRGFGLGKMLHVYAGPLSQNSRCIRYPFAPNAEKFAIERSFSQADGKRAVRISQVGRLEGSRVTS